MAGWCLAILRGRMGGQAPVLATVPRSATQRFVVHYVQIHFKQIS